MVAHAAQVLVVLAATGVDLLVTGDTLVLTAGARWDWVRHDIRDDGVRSTRPSATQDSRFQRANPRVGVNYNVAPALGLFASYGEGFRRSMPSRRGATRPAWARGPCPGSRRS